jgi:hypothetical protein
VIARLTCGAYDLDRERSPNCKARKHAEHKPETSCPLSPSPYDPTPTGTRPRTPMGTLSAQRGRKNAESDYKTAQEEIRAASLQFVRKISGLNKPSKANESSFLAAVDEVAAISTRLLHSLETTAPPKNREEEAAKAKARAAERFGA